MVLIRFTGCRRTGRLHAAPMAKTDRPNGVACRTTPKMIASTMKIRPST